MGRHCAIQKALKLLTSQMKPGINKSVNINFATLLWKLYFQTWGCFSASVCGNYIGWHLLCIFSDVLGFINAFTRYYNGAVAPHWNIHSHIRQLTLRTENCGQDTLSPHHSSCFTEESGVLVFISPTSDKKYEMTNEPIPPFIFLHEFCHKLSNALINVDHGFCAVWCMHSNVLHVHL